MKKQIIFLYVSMLLVLIMTAMSCKKSSSDEGSSGNGSGTSTMNIRMTDGPGNFDKVYLDIQEVWVNVDGKGWVMVPMTRRGVYSILELNNGDDTLIASLRMNPGHIKQVKLVLGTNNHVVVNGTMQTIESSTIDQSRLIINVDETLDVNSSVVIWIDLDMGRSLYHYLNAWRFKPWMRCFTHHKTGAIKGTISPVGSAFYTYVVPNNNVNDTFGTYIRSNGYFKIFGLKPGAYKVNFITASGTVVKSLNAVNVNASSETNLNTVTIP
jgi:hypothetical protein